MKPSIITAICLFNIHLMAEQDRPATSTIQDSISYDFDPDMFIFEEEDDYIQQPGQVRALDLAYAKHIRPRIVAALEAAPDDATGKQSPWYPQLQAWMVLFDQFLASKSHTDLFALIPTMVEFRNKQRTKQRSELSEQFHEIIRSQVDATSEMMIRAMADCIREANGEISAPLLQKFVHFHSVWHLSDPWREDEFIPIEEAGIFILDPEAVIAQLKAGPWQRAEFLIGNVNREADNFFSCYTEDDDWGLPVLETKYRANKAAIDAKFEELKAWVAAQKAQAENPEEEE